MQMYQVRMETDLPKEKELDMLCKASEGTWFGNKDLYESFHSFLAPDIGVAGEYINKAFPFFAGRAWEFYDNYKDEYEINRDGVSLVITEYVDFCDTNDDYDLEMINFIDMLSLSHNINYVITLDQEIPNYIDGEEHKV